jgi:hypothetical protein
VLWLDEKCQIRALDRTQPGLPLKPGKAGTMTHDYTRNGITTLFAALDVLEGTVISRCMQGHRHQEFLRFLNTIERAVPAGKVVKRGSFRSIIDLQAAIHRYIAEHDADPQPFTWTKPADQILASLNPPNAPVH